MSVVMNALASASHASKEDDSVGKQADFSEGSMRCMGKCWPITPVDMTRDAIGTDDLVDGNRLLTPFTIDQAASKPLVPVTAFAQPELTTNALA